jgi:hypothetical protein
MRHGLSLLTFSAGEKIADQMLRGGHYDIARVNVVVARPGFFTPLRAAKSNERSD